MIVKGKALNIDELTKEVYDDKNMLKMRGNGIYLSDNEVQVLKKYNIDYKKYSSLSSLVFGIEEILNEEVDADDLEQISSKLSELNYYNNTNK